MRRTVLALAGLLIPLGVLGITNPVLATASPPLHPIASTSTGPMGDGNRDGIVDLFDLVIIAAAYNPDGPVADARADINDDGVVDLFDLVLVAASFRVTSPSVPPTSSMFSENTYLLHEERIIGGYTVRVWRDPVSGFSFSDLLTIDADRQPRVQIESVSGLDDLTGSDVTGEGHPDVIIHTFTGGAHCCFSTLIYDLGATMTKVLETPESNCQATLRNIDSDEAPECLTCDDLFSYVYCPYVTSPMVKVILDYVPGQGYVPAKPALCLPLRQRHRCSWCGRGAGDSGRVWRVG